METARTLVGSLGRPACYLHLHLVQRYGEL